MRPLPRSLITPALSAPQRHALAVALALGALGLQHFLRPLLGPRVFLLLYPALVLATLMTGFWSGLLATLVATLGAWYYFIEPIHSFEILHSADAFALLVFSSTGILFSILSGRFQLARQREAAAQASLEAALSEQKQALEREKEAVRVRDEFLSIASHELKTPLTPLKLQIQHLNRQIRRGRLEELSPEKLAGMLQSSDKQIGRLSALIENLLDVSRITAGRLSLNPEELDATELVRETVRNFQDQVTASGCEVVLVLPDAPVRAFLDRIRVEQVLANLLTNALKYAPGARVEIGVEATSPDELRLWVKDSGKGVPIESHDRVFDRFERATTPDQVSGLGLGLYISRQIVEAHGGRIRLESPSEGGAVFQATFPRTARNA